jgi:hypothetical protein
MDDSMIEVYHSTVYEITVENRAVASHVVGYSLLMALHRLVCNGVHGPFD